MDNIASYLQELKINKCSVNTVKNIEYFWNERRKNSKELESWTKDDVNQCVLTLMQEYKPSSVETYKKYIKQYFNWAGKGDIVKHLKIKTIDTPIVRADLPTLEEINRIIAATSSPFYKALISLLYESGARISEVLMMRVSDVKEDKEKGLIAHVCQTKTGIDKRPILCLFSGQYIRNLIMYAALDKDDYLFRSPDNPQKPIYPENARETIKRIAKKAGIEKKITPHIFRHVCATEMLTQGYQESIVNKKMGWKPHSNVSARYKHITGDDVIRATLEKNGKIISQPVNAEPITQPEKMDIATTSKIITKLNDDLQQEKENNAQLKRDNELILRILKEKGLL